MFSLAYANQFLMDQFSARNIIPISLKKPQKTPHIDIVNSNEYVTRLAFGRSGNSDIEYTMGNKDVYINLTFETIRLEGGQKASTARRNPQNIKGWPSLDKWTIEQLEERPNFILTDLNKEEEFSFLNEFNLVETYQ